MQKKKKKRKKEKKGNLQDRGSNGKTKGGSPKEKEGKIHLFIGPLLLQFEDDEELEREKRERQKKRTRK